MNRIKSKVKSVHVRLHAKAHKHAKHIERGRVMSELIACGYVFMETHFISFACLCVVWAIVDVAKLVDEI